MKRTLRLRDLGRWRSGGTPPKSDEQAWAGDLPWISAKDIAGEKLRKPSTFITETAARHHSTIVDAGSLLVIVRGMALAHGLPVALSDRRCAFNQDLRALISDAMHDARYLHYALLGNRSRLGTHIDRAAHGTARVTDSIYEERIWAPELIRQRQIADFLDRECERIAEATTAAARTVRVLAQQEREAFERLTLGAPNVALRRRLLRIEQGWSPECEATTAAPGEWGVLKVGCVNHGRFRAGEHKRLPDDLTPRPALEIRPGDLLMSRANTRELVGSAAVVDDVDGRRLMLCDLLYRLRFGEAIRPGFLALAIGSRPVRGQIEASASGAAGSMPKVSQSIIRRLLIPDLPLAEQESIERAVAVRSAILAEATRGLTELQDRLAEYRDALITEAVTGQLDVLLTASPTPR